MQPETRPVPTLAQLAKASVAAAAIAAAVLTCAVLPAEYGIDPTGAGRALGLTQLHATSSMQAAPVVEVAPAAAAPIDPVSHRDVPPHTETLSVTLLPEKGAEIKASMEAGDSFYFSWRSEAPVNFDMHGEPRGAPPEVFTSYWKGLLKSHAQGSFTAPFAGAHGWYWKNRGSEPVTVTVEVTGYFDKLYVPVKKP